MFAVLHIADFALHAVLRTEANVDGKPAALFSGTNKKSVVIAANPSARCVGVELGMSAPQAVARCAKLLIRAPSTDAETEARTALLAVGFTLSPTIEDTAPGVCTCDLKGFDSDRLTPTVHTATIELNTLGLPVTAGIARTPLLALYAARAERVHNVAFDAGNPNALAKRSPANRLVEDDRTESEIRLALQFSESSASYLSASRSVNVLSVTDEKSFLAPLPLPTADPSPALAEVLANWGLRTLGDLTALPCDEIVRRFGTEGLDLWTRASGGISRPLHPVTPRQIFSAAMEFEQEIETLEPLLFLLRRFLDRLTLELRASQHVATDLRLTLSLEDDTQHTRNFRLPEPTADTEILFRALHTHLESLQTAASISAVELELTPARPLVRQQGLFETGLRDPHGFAETLARVSALVGSERVGTPQFEDTHRPDAVKLMPPAAVIPTPAAPPLHLPNGLSLRRFRPPLSARLGNVGDRTYLWSELVRGEIFSRSAPYCSSGDWWQADRRWERTEWDIALTEGGLYRLLLIGDSYFIEGEYD